VKEMGNQIFQVLSTPNPTQKPRSDQRVEIIKMCKLNAEPTARIKANGLNLNGAKLSKSK